MNYKKIYDSLCLRGQTNRNLEQYCEIHHIVPKCLGGGNEPGNLTKLTFREHFLAHWLLCKIHKDVSKIHYAFLCMLRKQPNGNRILNSRMFETIKKNFSEFKKWHSKIENPGRTAKSRASARNRMINKNPISLNPEKNHTSQPVAVYWNDGTSIHFSYAKQLTLIHNIPYGTVKHMLTHDTGSKKWGIDRIERLKKE